MHKKITELRQAIKEGTLKQDDLGILKKWPLLHFSEHSERIQEEGFLRGEYSLSQMDCTYGPHSEIRIHEQPGFNFAFNAIEWDVENDMLDYEIGGPLSGRNFNGMFAGKALLFVADGLYTHHYDEFKQVIVWGPDVNVASAMLLENVGVQYLDGEPVCDENGNDADCWTLKSPNGELLVQPGDCLSLRECIVHGLCQLRLSKQVMRETAELYEQELSDMGLTLKSANRRHVDNCFEP